MDTPDTTAPPVQPAGSIQEKRGADRVQKIQFAKLHGRLGAYRAMIVNLSRTGALLTIVDPQFETSSEESQLGLVGLRVASHFGDSFEIEFLAEEIVKPAEVIRITEGRQDGQWTVYLGCRFLDELDDAERAKFGLPETAPGGVPEEPAETSLPDGTVPVVAPAGSGPILVVPAGGTYKTATRRKLPERVRIEENGPMLGIRDLLGITVDRRASDLHLKGGSPIRIRVDGTLKPLGRQVLTPDEAEGLVVQLLVEEQIERFAECGDLDLAYALEGRARFRVNVMRTRDVVGMVARRIPDEVPTIDELGLAPACTDLAARPRGLVLVTGPTGSGKSTTLAAMVNHINHTRPCHIVTMEDPIEFVHTELQAHISQREIGRDTKDFASALKRALRQDPDVILVGEMRDLETISLAVTAAETGHLVFATLHTTSAILSVDRIVDVFPPVQQRQIRMQLADALQGIISQILLPRKTGGVVVAQEVLTVNSGVRALIREGKTPQIGNQMQTGAKDGMQTLEDCLNDLVARGTVTQEIAVQKANHPQSIVPGGRFFGQTGNQQQPQKPPPRARGARTNPNW